MKNSFRKFLDVPLANLYDYPTYNYVINSIVFSQNDVVLDLGCGIGIIEYILANQVKQIIGIDISKPSINYLEQNFKKDNVKFLYFDSTHSAPHNFKDFFDKIICIDVLEHVKEPQKILKFILETLNSKGQAVITFPINNLTHGNIIRNEDVNSMLDGFSCNYQSIFLKENFSFLVSLYRRIRHFFPLREANTFENSFCYEMLKKQEKNKLYRLLYRIVKLIIVFLSQFIKDPFKEESKKSQRCLLIITKAQK